MVAMNTEVEPVQAPIQLQPVADAVQRHTGKTWDALCSAGRTQRLSLVRKMAALALREVCPDMSLRDIGRELGGRDHSTVIYWMSSIKRIVEEDVMYRTVMQNIYQDAVRMRDYANNQAAVS